MLSEEQIDIFGEAFTDIFQKLENDIIADIARRVRGAERFTETAELQARFMRDMGWSPYRIRVEVFRQLNADKDYRDLIEKNTLEAKALQQGAIAEAREALRKTAPELYKAAGDMSFNADLSMWREAGKKLQRGGAVERIIREMKKRGTDDVLNLTKTLGFKTPSGNTRLRKAYTSVLNDALARTVSGGYSHTAAIEAAVRSLARSGLRTVDFVSGVSREIDGAARNAVITSLGQLTGDIMQTNIEESDVPMVQVSEHWGARESHALWQGKIFMVEQFKAVCGYGEPSNPDHIYSYNCRHTHYPYWPGISEPIAYQREPGPFTVNGRQYTYYEATQKQRTMERKIRALKREVNAGGDKAILGSEIRQRTREYKAFSDACGIREKLERLYVLGYDRSTVARVQKAVKIEDIRKLIKSDAVTKKVNVQKQNRHILGSPGCIEGRSYIYGNVETAQALVDRYHGTGDIKTTLTGGWKNREAVNAQDIIGVCIDGETGEAVETNRFTIHYGGTGTHVVPATPERSR